ncbi:Hint domain-containing protein [Neorhizobium lilium]|uniref:Hint domain-containing protein n=1 Tax=Neorhizobium lilium TaxID=2503024 RepID=A0A444LM74_9HYPH|nr:Hint domain-containing protein [Neorhizobium lilium]RWX81382.1 Hint domain-containing protein [Neorhizobium lilium]
MASSKEQRAPRSRARRHFLGVAGATGAKVAVTLGGMTMISSLPAQAMGRKVRRDHDIKQGNTNNGNEPNCFLAGTNIMTPRGEVPIEDLCAGDLVETVRGRAMPIKWIGRQSYRRSGPSWQDSVMPIRIARNALAPHTPHRDLFLSPRHALYINGVLIRVKELVNGISIIPDLPEDRTVIEYFNIMLDSHEAIVAEGTPVETFLHRANNHESFANFDEFERLCAADSRVPMTPFAPILGYESGREHLTALLLMGASRFMQIRDPIQDIYEMIVARTKEFTN